MSCRIIEWLSITYTKSCGDNNGRPTVINYQYKKLGNYHHRLCRVNPAHMLQHTVTAVIKFWRCQLMVALDLHINRCYFLWWFLNFQVIKHNATSDSRIGLED